MQRAWCANLARRKERLAAEAVAHTEALEWRLQEAQVRESSSSSSSSSMGCEGPSIEAALASHRSGHPASPLP